MITDKPTTVEEIRARHEARLRSMKLDGRKRIMEDVATLLQIIEERDTEIRKLQEALAGSSRRDNGLEQ